MTRNGRAPETIYTRSFEKILGKSCASGAKAGNCGSVSLSGRIIMDSCCDSYGGISGISAPAGAVLRLACSGALASGLAVNAVFPADAEERLVKSCMRKCEEDLESFRKISISGAEEVFPGELSFSEGAGFPVITASACGTAGSCYTKKKILPGYGIVMTGFAGWQGTLRLAERYEEKLLRHYSRDFLAPVLPARSGNGVEDTAAAANAMKVVRAAASAGAAEISACGSGGVYAGLWELGKQAGLGLSAILAAIPVRQETIEVSDYFNCDPYVLESLGTFLIACEDAEFLTEELARAGVPAVQIGSFTEGSDRVVIGREEDRRFLTPFAGDSFYTACENAGRI
ncbi:MAG: hypothetical protein K5637_01480 [Lachnospiraceae bacterium]|nr:hypothetical protein [Lachnospiraceae bacterium]